MYLCSCKRYTGHNQCVRAHGWRSAKELSIIPQIFLLDLYVNDKGTKTKSKRPFFHLMNYPHRLGIRLFLKQKHYTLRLWNPSKISHSLAFQSPSFLFSVSSFCFNPPFVFHLVVSPFWTLSQDLRPIRAMSCSYTIHAIAAIIVLRRHRGTPPRKNPAKPCS